VDIARECRKRSSWSDDVSVTLYEEIGPGNLEKLVDLTATLDQGLDELMDGDIVVYHKSYDAHRANNKLKSLQDFYTYQQFKLVD
jgi:hypothetical protein